MLLRDKEKKKESGILLALSSLPSSYGIGTLGKEAFGFVDFLKASGQRYWQLLPLVPLGEGNSPYKSPSCFAGEILYIDLDLLKDEGLLFEDEIPDVSFPKDVDYDAVRRFKLPLIKKAVSRFDTGRKDYVRFVYENRDWLSDYSLFMAAAEENGSEELAKFPEGLRVRDAETLACFSAAHTDAVTFYNVTQFLFYRQFDALKAYANKNGVKLIGDIPFYVSLDSADVWESPENFRLGKDLTPTQIAGVPPDIFSATGQLWGNPIYDWEYQKRTDYEWWCRRLAHCRRMYDVIRIDHFRAFASFYVIPNGAPDARSGNWEKGVGLAFWEKVFERLGPLDVIAEDLGGDEPEVKELVKDTGFPNMKVVQFGFSGDPQNPHLPQNFDANCVCYTGTHDNDTSLGWYLSVNHYVHEQFERVMPGKPEDPAPYRMIKAAANSKADLVMIPMQDYLLLDSNSRMNTPGVPTGNWVWRLSGSELTDRLCETVKKLTKGRTE